MLEKLHIQNFRLFKNYEMEEMSHVNLVVGENNVGKSSLLEAIYLLVSQESPTALLDVLESRGEISFRDDSMRSRGYDISHLFWGHNLRDGVAFQLRAFNDSQHLSLNATFFVGAEQLSLDFGDGQRRRKSPASLKLNYGGIGGTEVGIEVIGNIIERRPLRLYPDSLFSAQNANYITTKGMNYDFLARLWDNITLTPRENDIIHMLQIIEPNVERISFTSRQTTNSGILIKQSNQEHPVPLGSMGDGMHRILAIAAALANSERGYLLIDEIDTGLYYRTITDMWRLVMETATRRNVQVFATTHSWDCVRSFAKALEMQDDKEVGALFRLERRAEEEIAAVRYGADDLSFIVSQNIQNLEVR